MVPDGHWADKAINVGVLAGIDIGGTKVLVGVFDDDGKLVNSKRYPTSRENPVEELNKVIDQLRDGKKLDGIAISTPGPFDREQQTILAVRNPPRCWQNLALGEILGSTYRCHTVMENDANCAALAEAVDGAGSGMRTVVYYTISTGIGTGVVIDQTIARGAWDTEGGHQIVWPGWLGGPECSCGAHGCLEAVASGWAIARRYGVEAGDLGDQDAWDEIGRWLGLGVVNTACLLDPDAVVFGGGVTKQWDKFEKALVATVEEELQLLVPPRISLGTLGEERNLLGAYRLFIQTFG